MVINFFKVFDEDVVGLSLLEEVIVEQGEELYEIFIVSDVFGVVMCCYLKGCVDQEVGVQVSVVLVFVVIVGCVLVVMMWQL